MRCCVSNPPFAPASLTIHGGGPPSADASLDFLRWRAHQRRKPAAPLTVNERSVGTLKGAGAVVLAGGERGGGNGFSFQNTLLKVDGATFLKDSEALQEEAFGNESLLIIADDVDQAVEVTRHFEGNLTGCIYSDTKGDDESYYRRIEPVLRKKVGRLLNDKMPTGVAVVPSMNHGGPYPATGHPGFTAVGLPASISRFAMLECYDNVREHRLPSELRNQNPSGALWRLIDQRWSQEDVGV